MKTPYSGSSSSSSLVAPCKLISIPQRERHAFLLPPSDKIHVCVNDDVSSFPVTTLRLYFHNTIDVLKHLTADVEVGLSHAVKLVRCAAQNSDKNTGKS